MVRVGRPAVLFDWDGTLCDSDFLFDLAVVQVLEGRGLTKALSLLLPEIYIPRQVPLRKLIRLPEAGRADILREIAATFAQLDSEASLFPGMRGLLESFAQENIPLAVVTGRLRASFMRAAEKEGVLDFFTHTVCAEDAPNKPAPDGILDAIGVLDAASAVYVGNTRDDMLAAGAAQCDFLGVALCTRSKGENFDATQFAIIRTVDHLTAALKGFLATPLATCSSVAPSVRASAPQSS